MTKYRLNNKHAFTLAEVLITLGIIGVVAAMTIPTLIANYKKNVTITQLKKVNSTLAQAFTTAQAENGYANFAPTEENVEKFYDTYWRPYLRIAKECETYEDCGYTSNQPYTSLNGATDSLVVVYDGRRSVILQDGTILVICLYTVNDDSTINQDGSLIIADINGSAKPNKMGNDVFLFKYTIGKGLVPRGNDLTEEELMEECATSGRGLSCAEVIRRSGWEIPDWYPIKF